MDAKTNNLTAYLVGGPRDGDTGDYRDGVVGLLFPSHCWPVDHAYRLSGISGGVATYTYCGALKRDHGPSIG